jgi:hypothetical protein
VRITRTQVARGGLLLALVGIEAWLAHSMTSAPSIKGFVDTHSFGVSSAQKGIVRKIHVHLGEHVTAGQIVAELEPGLLDSEIATATAERQRLIAATRAGNPDEHGLQAIDAKLEHLAEKRDAIHLRAPVDGTVELLNAHPGDPVNADAPIATIVTADTRHVIACVPEARVGEVDIGSTADVSPSVGGGHLHGVVESMTPAISELPPRCQPVVAKPRIYGRIAMIALDRAAGALPGETELVAFGPRVQPSAVPVATEAPSPQPITVPLALSALSRVEASGLVWVQSLDRYIVVSDETGAKGRHAPWLFSMSRRGVLDPDPIVVSELTELDDIESIASDERDGLWVLASQSKSEKGNRPPARELLAHLVPEGIGYRADKQVALAPLLAGTQIDLDKLDIEGMAFRKGALYLGLKSPAVAGKATILKVASPERLFANDAAGAQISVFGQVALPVLSDGKQVTGGIADMTFVSETALVVAATAPGARQQDGVLYLVRTSDFTAVPVQTFPDLKPEGVALSPDGRLAVVFDRGHDVPLWTELEPPHVDL